MRADRGLREARHVSAADVGRGADTRARGGARPAAACRVRRLHARAGGRGTGGAGVATVAVATVPALRTRSRPFHTARAIFASLAVHPKGVPMSGETESASGVDNDAAATERLTFDITVAHSARVHDYWLGGKDHYPADRAAGDAVIAAYPGIVESVRANRAFLARVVRFLAAEAGIRQFLDIGTGIPTANNTHEVAQSVAPDCRVVYVDYDPVVLAHARALLVGSPEGATDYIDADLCEPQTILEQAARTLDLSRPVAVMLIAVMHLIGDDAEPYRIVARLMDAAAPGSYLALSQVASDIQAEQMAEAARRYNSLAHETQRHRSRAEVTRFFDGLELIEPGVVPVQEWRAATAAEAAARSAMWGAVARKR
jgi:hypothetical protein